MWVPLIENNEHNSPGADYFIQKNIDELFSQSGDIDTVLLACTHYPLLIDKLKQFLPVATSILSQGEIVANSLSDYLQRHNEIEAKCTKNGRIDFFTTDSTSDFDDHGTLFFGTAIKSTHLEL